jgi:transcriptional regulator with XRE-family HTH domain
MRADERKEQLNRQIGRRVIHFRISRDLSGQNSFPLKPGRTQTDVANALGLGVGAISAIEAGRRKLSAAELVLLAEYFKVPVTELLP